MKNNFLIILLIIGFFSSCSNNIESELNPPDTVIQLDKIIVSSGVNIRSLPYPDSSEVIFMTDDTIACEIIERSNFIESIGKRTDFWYKISKNDTIGWVYGTFTSKKLSENPVMMIAKFKNIYMNDRYHLIFEITDKESNYEGNIIDFGLSGNNNNLNNYLLGKKDYEYEESNPEMIDKEFYIWWSVKITPIRKDGKTIWIETPLLTDIKLIEEDVDEVENEENNVF